MPNMPIEVYRKAKENLDKLLRDGRIHPVDHYTNIVSLMIKAGLEPLPPIRVEKLNELQKERLHKLVTGGM